MSDYLYFEGQIVSMDWGKSTYTVLPLPTEIGETLAATGTKRVEGEIADHPINLALTKAPVIDAVFLYTGKAFLRQAGLEPGDRVDVRLRPVADDVTDVPDDVAHALRGAQLTTNWDALTPGKRRGLLATIVSAKRPETRKTRIAKLLEALA